MNEIYKRRSIRSYNESVIDNADILKLVKAGMNAPSAKNSRPSEFIIIDNKEVLKSLSNITPHMFMLNKCDKAIVVFGNEKTEYWQQDMSATTQNILLEATSLNISTCWMGIAPIEEYENEVRKVLSIPEDKRVLSVISLGYTDKEKESNDYFDSSKVFYNNFN
ncbi:MAG: nitroreductase family protein [bacterium]